MVLLTMILILYFQEAEHKELQLMLERLTTLWLEEKIKKSEFMKDQLTLSPLHLHNLEKFTLLILPMTVNTWLSDLKTPKSIFIIFVELLFQVEGAHQLQQLNNLETVQFIQMDL